MSAFKKIAAGLNDAIAFSKGDASRGIVREQPDVKRIRQKTKMTQQMFAKSLHIPVTTLRDWEQGRRSPEGAARTLLRMVDADPRATLELLQRV